MALNTDYTISTYAGGNGEFVDPQKIARLSNGDFIVSDAKGNSIKKISNGVVTTIAGTGVAGYSGDNGNATAAKLDTPYGVAVLNDEIYIADSKNNRIRKIDTTGVITTIAGTGVADYSGDNGLAINAQFDRPMDVAFNADNELLIVDMTNKRVRKIVNGTITTIVGTGTSGHSGDNGLAINAAMSNAYGVRVHSNNIYVSDSNNFKVRMVDSNQTITTIAGTGSANYNGDNILATAANLNHPTDVAFLSTGEMLIADTDNYRVRLVLNNGTIITIAGNGTASFSDSGLASSSGMSLVTGFYVVSDDSILVADAGNARIRLLSLPITTCFGVDYDVASACSGHGVCSALDTCVCSADWTGANCNITSCAGVASNDATVCNSHGSCVALNNCTCTGSWTGPYCNITSCNGVASNDNTVCSAHGSCTGLDTCVCSAGWSGPNCNVTSCYGVASNDNTVCGGHGSCTALDTCVCSGSWTGANCNVSQVTSCYGVDANVASVCSNHGSCSALDTCVCSQGWYGANCNVTSCYGVAANVASVCGGHGTCSALDTCVCASSWIGANCNVSSSVSTPAATYVYEISTFAGGNGEFVDPQKIVELSNGDLIVSDAKGCVIKKISKTTKVVTTIAGTGVAGFSGDNGPATSAKLDTPYGVAVLNDEIYIADSKNSRVRKIDTTGVITTIAGTGVADYSGDNGLAINAQLNTPMDVAFNADNELLVVDMYNKRVRKILTNGTIVTIIGGKDGNSGDNGLAINAGMSNAYGVRVHSNKIYVSDSNNFKVRMVDSNQIITTIAGTGSYAYNGDNILATAANLNHPTDVAFLSTGEMLIADTDNYRVRMVLTNNTIVTVAGNGTASFSDGKIASSQGLSLVTGILVVSDDEIYITDAGNSRVRLLSTKQITCFGVSSGDSSACSDHGSCTALDTCICSQGWFGANCNVTSCNGVSSSDASVCSAHGSCTALDTCVCSAGWSGVNCNVTSCAGVASNDNTVCGGHGSCTALDTCVCSQGWFGANCNVSQVTSCYGVDANVASVCSNHGSCSALDTCVCSQGWYGANCNVTSCYGVAANVASVCGGHGTCSALDTCTCTVSWTGANCNVSTSSPSQPAATYSYMISTFAGGNGEFVDPQKIVKLSNGDLIVSDAKGCVVKKISKGVVTTIAGTGVAGFSGDNGPATSAKLNFPYGVAVLNDEIYIADSKNSRVRKIDTTGVITTIAGTGVASLSGDNGLAINAQLNTPMDVAFNADNELLVVDMYNKRVRKIMTNGTIVTIIGGKDGYSGDDGLALNAGMSNAYGVRVHSNNIYVSDSNNHKVRMVDSNQIITTIAGTGSYAYNGDNILATAANLNHPTDVAFLSTGEMLIADTDNYRVRMVLNNGTIVTIAGNGTASFSDGKIASSQGLSLVTGILVVSDDEIYITDAGNSRVRLLTTKPITCNGIESTETGSVCNAHGKCVNNNLCVCASGWTGANCDVTSCFGVSATSKSVCNAHGTCSSLDQCTCATGWSGANCNITHCNSVASNDASVCSGHGSCVDVDSCTCTSDYTGQFCADKISAEFTCYGVGASKQNVCSGNGACVDVNNCVCKAGWTGTQCDTAVTPQSECTNATIGVSTPCFGIGTCTNNVCSCQKGYYGKYCTIASSVMSSPITHPMNGLQIYSHVEAAYESITNIEYLWTQVSGPAISNLETLAGKLTGSSLEIPGKLDKLSLNNGLVSGSTYSFSLTMKVTLPSQVVTITNSATVSVLQDPVLKFLLQDASTNQNITSGVAGKTTFKIIITDNSNPYHDDKFYYGFGYADGDAVTILTDMSEQPATFKLPFIAGKNSIDIYVACMGQNTKSIQKLTSIVVTNPVSDLAPTQAISTISNLISANSSVSDLLGAASLLNTVSTTDATQIANKQAIRNTIIASISEGIATGDLGAAIKALTTVTAVSSEITQASADKTLNALLGGASNPSFTKSDVTALISIASNVLGSASADLPSKLTNSIGSKLASTMSLGDVISSVSEKLALLVSKGVTSFSLSGSSVVLPTGNSRFLGCFLMNDDWDRRMCLANCIASARTTKVYAGQERLISGVSYTVGSQIYDFTAAFENGTIPTGNLYPSSGIQLSIPYNGSMTPVCGLYDTATNTYSVNTNATLVKKVGSVVCTTKSMKGNVLLLIPTSTSVTPQKTATISGSERIHQFSVYLACILLIVAMLL